MLADSVLSEAYRFARNRMTVLWSVLFVPVLFVIGGLIFHAVNKGRMTAQGAPSALPPEIDGTGVAGAVNLMDGLAMGVSGIANGAILVFLLIAAATLYAGDYRWETWRLISARNSRLNQLLAKIAVFKLTALTAMIAFLIAGVVFSLGEALIYGKSIAIDGSGFRLGQFVLLMLLGMVRIVQYAMISLLAAVVTRSMLAALFIPVVLGFAQSLMGGPGLALLGWEPSLWQSQLLLPGLAYDTLKAVIGDAPGQPDGLALKAVTSLALWALLPLAAAVAWFQRQDLSKE